MKVVCMIPARLDSKRFPRKIFSLLGEYSLLGNVIEAAKKVEAFDQVVVAVCSEEVAKVARDHGVEAIVTDPNIENGTLRIFDAIEKGGIEGDFFVNWQADEPFINEQMIKDLLAGHGNADVLTLKKRINKEEGMDASIVKVVSDRFGKALYFSRSLIPFERGGQGKFYKHIGLYAFTPHAIKKISNFQKTPLEQTEVLEQLRWLENGLCIQVSETSHEVMGIDTVVDLAKANSFLEKA